MIILNQDDYYVISKMLSNATISYETKEDENGRSIKTTEVCFYFDRHGDLFEILKSSGV